MSEPVSWLLIEEGWDVVDRDGEKIGGVEAVLGDRDIFSGLVISTSLLGKPRWAEAGLVDEIEEDRVRLTLSEDEAERLPEYEPPEPV